MTSGFVLSRRMHVQPWGTVTLSELIERARDKTGDSYRELAERAQAKGFSLTGSSIHRLAVNPLRTVPEPQTLRALAYALNETVETVTLASVASLGIELSPEVTKQSRARAWLTLTEGRSDEEVAHLLRVTRTVAEALDSAAGAAAEPPGATPPGDEEQVRGTGGGPQHEE